MRGRLKELLLLVALVCALVVSGKTASGPGPESYPCIYNGLSCMPTFPVCPGVCAYIGGQCHCIIGS
jgi:hypothetical protein